MNVSLLVLWALAGWCGNEPRRWWKWPPPPPPPDPWWLIVVDIVGGIIGGWVYSTVWPEGAGDMAIYAAATSLGALIGGVLLHSVVNLARGGAARG